MKYLSLLIILIILSGLCFAQTYYLDGNFKIDDTGKILIDSKTNNDRLISGTSSEFTFKKGSYWLFNLTLPSEDLFSHYVFKVVLPQYSRINYIKTGGQFYISSDEDSIAINGFGENKSLEILIQYQLETDVRKQEKEVMTVYGIIILIFISGLVGVLYFIRKRRKTNPLVDDILLTQRQKSILELIRKSGRPINQSEISDMLKLPKSSVSRNVDTLSKNGFILKRREGMSTMLEYVKK